MNATSGAAAFQTRPGDPDFAPATARAGRRRFMVRGRVFRSVAVLVFSVIAATAGYRFLTRPVAVQTAGVERGTLVLAVLGFAAAGALVSVTHSRFPRTLVFEPLDTVLTFVVVLTGGVIASLFGIWRALRTPASLALGS